MGTKEIAQAMDKASKTAYKAVMRPQEGTILTVGRVMAEAAVNLAGGTDDIMVFAKEILNVGQSVVKRTPEMLPVLKQAGVVDAGGEGLVCFLAGAIEGIFADNPRLATQEEADEAAGAAAANFAALASIKREDITFGYCTEFIISVSNFSEEAEDELKAWLETIGDSVAMVCDDEIVKVHVHTDNPGLVLEKAVAIGAVFDFKLDNMRLQHQEAAGSAQTQALSAVPQEKRNVGVVAVTSGEGFKEIFMDMGADVIIEGGQTMNPSAEDIAKGVAQVNAHNVIILPNNKNIILAAGQAVYLCEGQNVAVVESKTIPQGIAALMNYMPEDEFADNVCSMQAALNEVVTGQITVAVRDTELDGHQVNEGDYIGILEGKIVCTKAELTEAAKGLIDIMMSKGFEIFTAYHGKDAKEEDIALIKEYVEENYDGCELAVAFGGQAVYDYIFSAE